MAAARVQLSGKTTNMGTSLTSTPPLNQRERDRKCADCTTHFRTSLSRELLANLNVVFSDSSVYTVKRQCDKAFDSRQMQRFPLFSPGPRPTVGFIQPTKWILSFSGIKRPGRGAIHPLLCIFMTYRSNYMNFSTYSTLPAALGPGVYSASNRIEYQKQKSNVSGE
jgi:hypothetical protein